MVYRYKCKEEPCSAITERVQSIHAALPPEVDCEFCGCIAVHVIEAPAVMTTGMGNKPLDVIVGQDAAKRWDSIHEHQQTRDAVRVKSKQVGLTSTSPGNYTPISTEQQKVRSRGMGAVERDGFRNSEILPVRKSST